MLVVAGSVLGQWAGEGLEVSNAFVPHFDIPGAGIIATGSGTLGVSSGVIISSGSTLEVSGVSSLFGTNTNTFTGSTLINGGTLTFTRGANSSLNGITINASNDNPILLDAGSIIAAPDGSTQTLAAGESLTVTGPSKVTTPTGTTITVNDNVTIHLAGKPGDTATTGDTSTPPADPDPTPTPPADPDPTSTPPTDPA